MVSRPGLPTARQICFAAALLFSLPRCTAEVIATGDAGQPSADAAGMAPDAGGSSPDAGGMRPDASFGVDGSVADLCQGQLLGKTEVSYSALSKPAKGQAVTDPDFGTTIRRITDVAADWSSKVAIPVYPTIQAWNADETLLVLYVTEGTNTGWVLLDGKTYAFKKWLDINPPDVEQFYWDPNEPDLLYYVDNTTDDTGRFLTRLHVSTGQKDHLHDFKPDLEAGGVLASACQGTWLISGGEDPFYMSYDADLFGLGCALNYNGPGGANMFAAFTYRVSTNTIGQVFLNEATVPQAFPTGTATYFYDGTATKVLDPVTNAVQRTIAWSGEDHSDMLINAAGEVVVAGAQFDGPSGSGTLMAGNLSKGGVTTIIGEANGDPYPPSGTLVSGKAFQRPGWVAVAVTGEISLTSTYLDQEVLLANVDTGKFCRVAHHRTIGNYANASESNYWAQPNVVLSPSGTRVLFQSDWGNANPGHGTPDPNAAVDTYVLEMPGYSP